MFTAYRWSLWNHLGSLAFGSIIVAFIWGIQLILGYFYEKARSVGQDTSCYKIAACFVACFERFIKYVNRNSYIEVALRNINFCSGVYKSVELFAANVLRFGALISVLEIFLFFGSILISSLCAVIGHFLVKIYYEQRKWEESGTIAPTIVFFLVSFLICELFNSVLETASDTMFHSFLYEESELGSGVGAVKYCPAKIKDIIDNSRDAYVPLA